MIGDRIVMVPVDQIEVGDNIRETMDELELKGLALSIRENGIQIPLELVPGEKKPYGLLDGWRRFNAAKLLRMDAVPARIREKKLSEGERYQQQLVIQCQRSDLSPMQKARAVAGYLKATGFKQGEAAVKLGFSDATITRNLKLLNLPPWIQELVETGRIGFRKATDEIASEKDPERQAALAREAANRELPRTPAVESKSERNQPQFVQTEKASEAETSPVAELAEQTTGVAMAVRKFRAAMENGSITVSSTSLTPDTVIALLSELLGKARKLASRGVTGDSFFKSLRTAS